MPGPMVCNPLWAPRRLSGGSQEWWDAWLLSVTLGVAGLLGALIIGPITNEETRNIAVKTPSAMPGAHQFENLRRSLMSIGTEATSPRPPKRAVPPAPATRAVPTNGPMW